MKALIPILILSMLPQLAISQENSIDFSSIPKNTNKIIIHNNLNKEQNYYFIGETLINNGYAIDKVFKDFWTISTVPKSGGNVNISYILNFVARDSTIFLYGSYVLGVMPTNDNTTVANRGEYGSPIRKAFLYMMEFAVKLSDISNMEFKVEKY